MCTVTEPDAVLMLFMVLYLLARTLLLLSWTALSAEDDTQ